MINCREFMIGTIALSIAAGSVLAGALATPFPISQTGGSFPDVAYSTGSDNYLVIFGHGASVRGRLINSSGQAIGSELPISDAVGIFPDIAYNSQADEFLVVWDDQRDPSPVVLSAAWGQRIRASDGAKIGGNFPIGDTGSVRGSAVAWSPMGSIYLAVWWRGGNVTRGRWVSADGVPGASFDVTTTDRTLYPTVEFGGTNFLVTWDCDCATAFIRGRCVPPGGLPGDFVNVTNENGQVRSNIAYDPGTSGSPARWLVEFSQSHAGTGSDQYAQFASDACVPLPGSKPVASEPYHEGDTYFGGDIAFLPGTGRYLGVFQVSGSKNGSGAQELDREGDKVGGQVFLAEGGNGGEGVAADDEHGRFLCVWHVDQAHTWGRLYEPVRPVTQFEAVPCSRGARLSWRNSATGDCVSTLIRYKTTGFPAHPGDGQLVVEFPGSAGAFQTFTHVGAPSKQRVYYTAFSKDSSFHFGEPVQVSVVTYAAGDFDGDDDVDQADFGMFQVCLSGDGIPKPPDCPDFDMDLDQDVDESDLSLLLGCWSGPGQLCDPACLP